LIKIETLEKWHDAIFNSDRNKPTNPYKWYHQSPGGRLRPAGNRWLKSRYLCRFCHDCQDETSGDEPEGSGGDSADNAAVDM